MHPHDMPDAMLPWSPDSEAGVLSALLRDNAVWDSVGDLLESKHFYDHANGLVFAAIGELVNACRPADMLTVFDALQKSGKADAAGGLEYLAELNAGVTGAANARRYAEIVRERALMRGILEAADSVKDLATKAGLSAAERIDQAQAVLQALQVGGAGRGMPTLIDANVVSLLDRIQSAADGTAPIGIPTGIPGLDRMIGGGFKGGKQVILAARPSVGKSSLAQQFCLNLAMDGVPTAFLSQEMSKDELTDRVVANLGRIELDRVISGQLQDDEWSRLSEAVEKLRQCPLFLDDQPALTLHDISAKARMLVRQHGVKLIVLDYLQLCSSGGKKADNRHHEIEELSRGLKTLARQLGITVLSLSQLNREVEKRTSGRPVLSDLKESGAIEEDADIVMLLSRGTTSPSGFQVINCDIPKNRQGRVGTLTLGFNGAHQQWHETVAPVEFKQPPRRHYTEDI